MSSTPIHHFSAHNQPPLHSSDEEGTLPGEYDRLQAPHSREAPTVRHGRYSNSISREEEHRLRDDLAMLEAEKEVSNASQTLGSAVRIARSSSIHGSRSRPTPVDEFDVNTDPTHEKIASFKPPERPSTKLARVLKRIHESSFLIRYFSYIMPLVALLLIPLLLGALLFKKANVGGVRLMWFSVWLEIVWLTLWCGRVR